MRPCAVVVPDVVSEGALDMPLIQNDHVIQALDSGNPQGWQVVRGFREGHPRTFLLSSEIVLAITTVPVFAPHISNSGLSVLLLPLGCTMRNWCSYATASCRSFGVPGAFSIEMRIFG